MDTLTASLSLEEAVTVAFEQRVARAGEWPIAALPPAVLQMNLGYRCNQRCAHCHVDASPERAEEMPWAVMQAALEFAGRSRIIEFDLTGGAPELHPHFRQLIERIKAQGGHVTDRCNLTILTEAREQDLPRFLAAHRVRVMASLPHHSCEMTDRVRGDHAFARSLAGLRALNAAGHGFPGTGLELVLVVNPSGAFLLASQESLEADFRAALARHGVVFTRLIALANMPIGRFLRFLIESGNLARYMRRLEASFNAATVPNLMCRTTLSLGWNGTLYDCDFNQALGLAIGNGESAHIRSATSDELTGRAVRCRSHCYGCTAGQGSSCTGAVAA